MRSRFFATLSFLAFVSLVSGCSSSADVANLEYGTWSDKLETQLEESACSVLLDVVTSGESISFAKSIEAKAVSAAKSVSVWSAETYLKKNAWVNKADLLDQSFDFELKSVIEPILNTRVKSLGNETASSSFFQRKSPWQSSFLAFALDDCGLSSDFQKSLDVVSKVQTSASSIRVAASNKPWYPKGFEVIGAYPDFAYKNISSGGCSYSFGSCAKFKIVSKTGCPSSLYVETNYEVNGEVVDWSNDSARGLGPGQVAVMETTFSTEGSGYWTITDLSCY